MTPLRYHLTHPRSVVLHAPLPPAIAVSGPKVEGSGREASAASITRQSADPCGGLEGGCNGDPVMSKIELVVPLPYRLPVFPHLPRCNSPFGKLPVAIVG